VEADVFSGAQEGRHVPVPALVYHTEHLLYLHHVPVLSGAIPRTQSIISKLLNGETTAKTTRATSLQEVLVSRPERSRDHILE